MQRIARKYPDLPRVFALLNEAEQLLKDRALDGGPERPL